jgi:hypothetical protein
MPGVLTSAVASNLLDHLFGGPAYALPANLYAGLSMGKANRAGVAFEPTASSYARAHVPNAASAFTPAAGGEKTNTATILFAPPAEDWGAAMSFFLADAQVGGRVVAMADFAAPRLITAGGPAPSVMPGNLVLTMG